MGFLAGVRVGSGLAAAAFIMAVTFGATVRAQGWGLLAPVICSLVVFSGSAQFTLATALAGGGGPVPAGPAAGPVKPPVPPAGPPARPRPPGRPVPPAVRGAAGAPRARGGPHPA